MTKLSQLREKKGLSLEKVCRDLNNQGLECSIASLNRWEKGKSIKMHVAQVLALYYKVPMDEIIG